MKQLSTAPNNEATRAHFSKLKQILAVCKDQKSNITEVNAFACSMYYGRQVDRTRWNEYVKFEGTKTSAQHICITLQNADYTVTVPDEMYPDFAKLLGLQYESKASDPSTVLQSFTVNPEILPALHKAVKFVSNDDLRPALQSICIDLAGAQLQIIATDAHQMYMSRVFYTDNTEYIKHMIPAVLIKKLPKKAAGPVLVEVLEGEKIRINGELLELYTGGQYVDWRVVVPDYEQSMTFDRVQLMQKTKQVAIHSNKITNQVHYHLNGSIELSAQDVDFSFEAVDTMPYINKSFPDLDISFNGKMLVNVLSAFKVDELQMYSAGKNNRAAIFTDGTDKVLLMPIWLHS